MRLAAGSEVEALIRLFSALPGLGPRSARRVILHLVERKESAMRPLAIALERAASAVKSCQSCGNIDTCDPCSICSDVSRDSSFICVVGSVGDLWAMERSSALRGCYHVLGGVLSPLDGIEPTDLNIACLIERAREQHVQEVLLALSATVEGQTTAHYITDLLADCNVKVSRLAQGVPVGGELDYLDDGTLVTAVRARTPF